MYNEFSYFLMTKAWKFLLLGLYLGIAILCAQQRFRWIEIFQKQYNMTDAFYYLQEFRAQLAGGAYYEKFSSFFFLLSLVGRLLHLDEQALYIGASITSLLMLSFALAWTARREDTKWLLPALALIPWLSDLIFFRHFAFLREFFSLSLLFLACEMGLLTSTSPSGERFS